jgi:putative radical SAM enzyme (TIGR03279 family)
MPLVIQEVLPRSLAARSGIKAGDKLLSINGHDIRDFIDLQFYGSDAVLDCELEKTSGEIRRLEIVRKDKTALGIEPETYKFDRCINNCIFCFIDQMPPSLRDTLYIKDDDYLYSFVFGNYISLTNLTPADFDRILEQRLSPLYVSVHTTNPELRRRMMRYPAEFDVLQMLHKLSIAGIQMHCQLVLVPGWNDGKELKRTLWDLMEPDLNILSIGIVPVGLTKYRDNLPELKPFTPQKAAEVVSIADDFRAQYEIDKIYCADEFFIKADIPIPDNDYYQDYPQVENGIGMVSLMLDNWKDKKRSFLRELRKKNKPVLMVTGVSAAEYVDLIATEITRKADSCPASVQPVVNEFMGRNVTVSGLLTFGDIRAQVKPPENAILALPANIFNHDGITLDGFSQLEIKEYWQRDILIVDPLFDDWEWI